MPNSEPTIRKTISFPRSLALRLAADAKSERRRFSPQVVKALEDFFAPVTVRQSKGGQR
jgi:hypothetical protein